MSVTFSAKTKPITTRPRAGDVRIGPSSTSGIPRDCGPLGEHTEPRGAKRYISPDIPTALEGSALTVENLERLGSRDPLVAALASVVARSTPSLTPSATRPDSANKKLARTKVKEWRGKDVVDMIKTWDPEWKSPYVADTDSIKSSEMFDDWESRAPTPSLRKEPEPVCVERAFPPREVTPKLGLDETVELLTRVLGASEEDPDLSALSAALKTKLGLFDVQKPPSTMSPVVELLTGDVKSCRSIRSSPMENLSQPFPPPCEDCAYL